jgi:putative glutamine amidotransferase
MNNSMSSDKPIRVGVPWRSLREERENKRPAYDMYLECLRVAGAEPVEVSLAAAGALQALAPTLDAVLLPGSSNDVDPQWYHTARHDKCGEPDAYREQADFALLDHAWSQRKPVLAICYGLQSLNVWRGGDLIQDIGSHVETPLTHEWRDRAAGNPEPHHPIQIVTDSELGKLAQPAGEVSVNSSHHQSVKRAGRDLKVTAHAPDGVVEALEHVADGRWVMAVQWHPERAPSDPLTVALFSGLVGAARSRATV